MLVAGTMSTTQLRQLSQGTPSDALVSRAVASVAWIDGRDARLLSVAPLSILAPGATYTVAVADPQSRTEFSVDPSDSTPVLRRLWPLADDPEASSNVAVWCSDPAVEPADLSSVDEPVALEPWGRAGRLQGGIGGALAVPGCVRWVADTAIGTRPEEAFDLPPPRIEAGASELRVDPAPIAGAGTAPGVEPAACAPPEIELGPGCVDVGDDRLIVRPPAGPLFWAIQAGDRPFVRVTDGERRFVVRLTSDDDPIRILLSTMDRRGSVASVDRSVRRGPERAHVVLNEVYANPVGPEPAQEWVEILNDGRAAVALAGYVLRDEGGSTALPDASLAAGSYALVVGDSFVADDEVDPRPAEGTTLVRVAALGKAGLANQGEALTLLDPNGVVMSRFPAIKPRSGVSIARLAPEALDDDPGAFAPSPNGSATPGAPN